RTAQKYRAAEGVWDKVRKRLAPFPRPYQHLPRLPRYVVGREDTVIVPGLLENARDPRVAEIGDRSEPDIIVNKRRDAKGNRNCAEDRDLPICGPRASLRLGGLVRTNCGSGWLNIMLTLPCLLWV